MYTLFVCYNLILASISPADYGNQQEGDVCGPCFNPDTNHDCGKCILGLDCVKDKEPYSPMRCRVTSGDFFSNSFDS